MADSRPGVRVEGNRRREGGGGGEEEEEEGRKAKGVDNKEVALSELS